jgi:hypothetical protein
MKSAKLKNLLLVAACAIAIFTQSACNRGYGCPNKFAVPSINIFK